MPAADTKNNNKNKIEYGENAMKMSKLLPGLALAATLAAAPVVAKELRVANILGSEGAVAEGYDYFAEKVKEKTDGGITMELTHGGLLLNASGVLTGVPDGIADIGFLVPPYFPGELPEFNLIGNASIVGRDAAAMTGAISEYIFTCEPCLEEHSELGHVYLGSYSTTPYHIQGTRPAGTIESLKGMKMRVGLPSQGRWAEHFGGIRVAIPGPEAFEAMSTGTIDAVLFSFAEFFNQSTVEVATHVTLLPIGVFNSTAPFSVSKTTWRDLSVSERAAMLEVAPYALAKIVAGYERDVTRAKKVAGERGIELIEPSPELVKASNEYIETDVKLGIEEAVRTTGVENAEAKMERYMGLIEKWKKLTADVDPMDTDALGALYWRHIQGKVDPETYAVQ